METDKIKQVLLELLELAKRFEQVDDIDPQLPIFIAVVTTIARRDFPILHSVVLLADDPLSGDAVLDLSRRVFEDMISLEFMVIKGKENMAKKFIKYAHIERWLNLAYLKKLGVSVDVATEKEVEDNFQRVKPEFIFKGDEVARSWSKTQFEQMIDELVKAGVIKAKETTDLLQGYILGNRKNHLSSEDVSAFSDKSVRATNIEHSLRIGMVITIVSYIKILSRFAEETGNQTLSNQLDELFKKLNVSVDNSVKSTI